MTWLHLLATLATLLALVTVGTARAADTAADPFNALQWGRGQTTVDRGDWYEWWYYKVVVPGTDDAFYFLYGTVDPWDRDGAVPASESYVGFGSFGDRALLTAAFPAKDFSASYDVTRVQVGPNAATDRRIDGDVVDPADGGHVAWSVTLERQWAFNAMGWALGSRDVSNISWYPAQASATMTGWIDYKGRRITLDHAPAYQDRNWGRSFPKWWVWLAANEFEGSPGTALAAGGGEPVVLNSLTPEVMGIGFRHKGREYSFRSADGARLELDVKLGKWKLRATNLLGQRIDVEAGAEERKFLVIPFRTPQGGTFYDHEALTGRIHVTLSQRPIIGPGEWHVIADVTSNAGGIEYGSADPAGSAPFLVERQAERE